jgi:hypothetical protein
MEECNRMLQYSIIKSPLTITESLFISGLGSVASFCGNFNEPSGSIKCREFNAHLSDYYLYGISLFVRWSVSDRGLSYFLYVHACLLNLNKNNILSK